VVYTIKRGYINSWSNPRTYMVILSETQLIRHGGPRVCPKSELPSLHQLSVGFLGISLISGTKISRSLLGIIEKRPDERRFHFLCEHPISSFWSKTGLTSRKINLFRSIFLHYIQYTFGAILMPIRVVDKAQASADT
jgi:hypothetical protein